MLRFCVAILASLLTSSAFAGSFGIFQAANNSVGWGQLGIGGAGYVPKMQLLPSSGIAVVERDQGGCSIANVATTGTHWYDVLSSASMPANTVNTSGGAPNQTQCDQLAIAPSATSDLWLLYGGSLYRSLNGSVSNFQSQTASFSLNASYPAQPSMLGAMQHQHLKAIQPTIAVDPNNPDVVYVSTPASGLEFSNNGTGSATFSQVTSVSASLSSAASLTASSTSRTPGSSPCTVSSTTCSFTTAASESWSSGLYIKVYGTSSPAVQIFGTVDAASSGTSLVIDVVSVQGSSTLASWTVSAEVAFGGNDSFPGHLIAFDTHGGTTTVSGQTRTKNIYVCTFGIGVYASTDGGQTWSLTSSGPPDCYNMQVDPNGVLWLLSYSTTGPLWTYNGTWTKQSYPPFTADAFALAIDPNNCSTENTCHVALAGGDTFYFTQTGGTGVGGNQSNGWSLFQSFTYSSSDIGWGAAWYANFGFIGVGGLAFDNSGNLWRSDELMLYSVPSLTVAPGFISQTVGEEEFEGNSVVVVGSNVFLAGWDVGCFMTSSPATWSAAQTCYGANAGTLHHAYQLDVDGNNMSVIADNQLTSSYVGYSGYSNNSGSTWTQLPVPSTISTNNDAGGCMAISGTQNIFWVPSDNNQGTQAPFYTTNAGSTWNNVSIPNVTGGFPSSYQNNYHSCAHDTGTAGVFYLYGYRACSVCGGGNGDWIAECTSGGASCSIIVNNPNLGNAGAAHNATLKTPPGEGGYFFFAYAIPLAPVGQNGTSFYYWHGGSSLTAIANVTDVTAYGFGGAINGHTFPSIWIAGWVNSVYGIYRCGTFDTDQCGSVGDWVLSTAYPNGAAYPIIDLTGDPSNSHNAYAVTVSGAYRGYTNWLLNRDLDPATNDNSPVGLAKAA